jgi:hypothetical protein
VVEAGDVRTGDPVVKVPAASEHRIARPPRSSGKLGGVVTEVGS